MNPDIIYEDECILVCHKPSGIATQSAKIGTPDMVSILKNYLYKNSKIKKEPYLSVIHRLDQPVEGLLVFSKTPIATKNLNKQLNNSGFNKIYHAILTGSLPHKEGTLTDYLIKDGRTNTSRVCSSDTPGAKKSILFYKEIKPITAHDGLCYTLAEITLETGRHHQIRVQMSNAGCPILGDRKYGANQNNSSASTLQLFACKLSFQHPISGKQMSFSLDLP